VSVRARGNQKLGAVPLEEIAAKLLEEARSRYVAPVETWRRPVDESVAELYGY